MGEMGMVLRSAGSDSADTSDSSPGRAEDKPLLGEVRAGDRVLVISASMGAGHDGAAKELKTRLERHGVDVDVVDYLAYLPAGTGWFVRWFYGKQLSVAPASYQVLYQTIERFRFAQRVCAFYTSTAKRPLAKAIARQPYSLIVSTYPLASQTMGQLRHAGRLDTPLATILTDFSVHALWVNKHIDLHMALSHETAALAKELGAGRVEVVEPLVAAKFHGLTSGQRALVRRKLNVPDGNRLVLIVAGSWGVGNVIGTVRELANVPGLTSVVVCGRNDDLRHKLASEPSCVPLGWVDWMPQLVGASDVLIQNAGGMTSLEAFASGIPVVSRNCIPGHGTANSDVMDKVGVALHGCSMPTLADALAALTPERSDQLVSAARAMFGVCPSEFMVAEPAEVLPTKVLLNPVRMSSRRPKVKAGHDVTRPGNGSPAAPAAKPSRPHHARRRVAQSTAAIALVGSVGWQLVPVASAAGLGAAMKPATSKTEVYVSVRMPASESGRWATDLGAGHVTLAADAALLDTQPGIVSDAHRRGVPIMVLASGRLNHTARNAAAGTALTDHGDIVAMADHHRLGARDQFRALWSDERLIAPTHVVKAPGTQLTLHGGDCVYIDGHRLTRSEVVEALAEVRQEAADAGLTESPLPATTQSG
jgi:UDP-N-acetylglucosamine:LPS N-acetylglucosamine transferase